MIEKISAVTLRVANMRNSVRFYRDVLGMELVYGGEDAYFSSLRLKDENSAFLNLEQGNPVTERGRPNVKVSWQITGVRQDRFAKANPLVVEEEKGARERGYYIHPELYGAAPEKPLEWAHHPELMRQLQERRNKQLGAIRKAHASAPPSKRPNISQQP